MLLPSKRTGEVTISTRKDVMISSRSWNSNQQASNAESGERTATWKVRAWKSFYHTVTAGTAVEGGRESIGV